MKKIILFLTIFALSFSCSSDSNNSNNNNHNSFTKSMDYEFTIYVFFHEHTPFALGIDTYLRPSLPIRFIPQHSFAG